MYITFFSFQVIIMFIFKYFYIDEEYNDTINGQTPQG